MKSVTKREAPVERDNSTLSDNISLFQALRVLQDDESDNEDDNQVALSKNKTYLTVFDLVIIFILIFIRKPSKRGNMYEDINAITNGCHCLYCYLSTFWTIMHQLLKNKILQLQASWIL